MFRVTTVRYLNDGRGRRRIVSRGPLHPDHDAALRWAAYLRNLGYFYEVKIESSASSQASTELVGLRN